MGRINRGILGGFSGKVANVVGGSWKGIATMRALPLSVANPRTAGQVAQRNKMTAIVEFAKILLVSVVKPLNDRFASYMSGYNRFVQFNIIAFDNVGTMIPANIKLSEGSLEPVDIAIDPVNAGDLEATVRWINNAGTGSALDTDVVYAVARNRNSGEISINTTDSERQNQNVVLEFDALSNGDVIDIWISLLSLDGKKVTNTSYASTIVM